MISSQIKRRIVAAALLVVYGTAGVLGYGLHALWHHHHGPAVACSGNSCQPKPAPSCSHCSCCGHHAVEPAPAEASSLQLIEEDCSICAFLAQAQTPVFETVHVEIVASVSNEVLVSEAIGPLFIPADHLARGPPHC